MDSSLNHQIDLPIASLALGLLYGWSSAIEMILKVMGAWRWHLSSTYHDKARTFLYVLITY